MVGEIGSYRVELVDFLLLAIIVHVLDLKLGHWVELLDLKIRRHAKLMLLEVLFGFLNVIWAVHYFKVDLEAGRLLFEVRDGEAPMGPLDVY